MLVNMVKLLLKIYLQLSHLYTKCIQICQEKNMLITVIFWTLYVGKNGRVEFWQIAVDKANSEEYFDESDDCSTDPVRY